MTESAHALHTLIYCSTGVGVSEDDLQNILHVARVNNTEAGISGILLYGGDEFVQVLEGPKARVEALFDRIEKDKRHMDVAPLVSTPITSRTFGDWSMAYAALSADNVRKIGGNLGAQSARDLIGLLKKPDGYVSEFITDAFRALIKDQRDDISKGEIKVTG